MKKSCKCPKCGSSDVFIKINAEYPFLCRWGINAKKLDKRTYVR